MPLTPEETALRQQVHEFHRLNPNVPVVSLIFMFAAPLAAENASLRSEIERLQELIRCYTR